MSFVGKPFDDDVFVSYSHGVFEGEHETDLKDWSQKFADEFGKQIAGRHEFKGFSLFIDKGIDRTADLETHLKERVSKAALLTILMNPHYLESEWCSREREWWYEQQRQNKFPDEGRVFICRIEPTCEDLWPPELPKGLGYFCYDQNTSVDKTRPYKWRDSKRYHDDYEDVLVELTGDMMQRLRQIKKDLEQKRREEEDTYNLSAGRKVVYLHARKEHESIWERNRKVLRSEGFTIFPSEPDPVRGDPAADREIAQRRVETLSGCDALLLLGAHDGRALEADLAVVGHTERHLARNLSDKLLPCAVLNDKEHGIATPQRIDMAKDLRIDWIDTSNGAWTNNVKRWLVEASDELERAG